MIRTVKLSIDLSYIKLIIVDASSYHNYNCVIHIFLLNLIRFYL